MYFRCYNGAWDSAALALFAKQDAALAELRKVEPEAHCTYHPEGEKFQVHVWGRPLSGFHSSRLAALQAALVCRFSDPPACAGHGHSCSCYPKEKPNG